MAKDIATAAATMPDLNNLVQSSLERTAENVRVLLVGPPKHGKTITACSLSDTFPEALPAPQLTHLNDGLLILFDAGGHDSLKGLNLTIPMIDLSRCTDEGSLVKGYNDATRILKQRVQEGQTGFAIVDSVSTFDKMLKGAVGMRLQKWELYDAMLGHHMRFFQALQALPIDIAFICHSKGLAEAASDSQADQRKASSLPGGATITADITGQTLAYYRAQVSMLLPVLATKLGKNTRTEYAIYPYGTQGFEAGTRFPLAEKEPANLGRLLKKIRGGNT